MSNTREIICKTKEFVQLSFKKYSLFLLRLTPHQNIAQTVLSYTIIGWIILCLPFMDTGHVSFLDNLFTAAAAVSTAGLSTVPFADSYTVLGKFVVLCLIQIGGIGYMTFSSFVFLSFSQKHRLHKTQAHKLTAEVILPNTLQLSDFLWSALIFTFVAETIGAALLFNYFRHHDFSVVQALCYSIFHSVSAFCTAGYSLWSNNLMDFTDSKTINIVISALSLAGSIGFIVVADVFNFIRRKTKSISLTTKIIVLTTFCLLAFGSFVLFVTSPHISHTEAVFQTVAAMTTAGFTTIDFSSLSSSALLILMLIMCIGGSPSGTAGGVKTTAFASVMALVYNRLRMRSRVEFLGRRVPLARLYSATSTIVLFSVFLFASVFLLSWAEPHKNFLDLVFESAAALSTSGFSTGITPTLSWVGKLIIIGTMLIGRIGVVTFGMALISKDEEDEKEHKEHHTEDVAV